MQSDICFKSLARSQAPVILPPPLLKKVCYCIFLFRFFANESREQSSAKGIVTWHHWAYVRIKQGADITVGVAHKPWITSTHLPVLLLFVRRIDKLLVRIKVWCFYEANATAIAPQHSILMDGGGWLQWMPSPARTASASARIGSLGILVAVTLLLYFQYADSYL